MTRKKQSVPTLPSQDAMLEHMAYLIFCEKKEACWRDFTNFEIDGRKYALAVGTIRNNLSKLRRQGKIEVAYRSIDSYYTLIGYRFKHPDKMTVNPARVHKRDLAELIERMVFGTPSAHDIHLRFKVHKIYNTLLILTQFSSPPPPLTSSSSASTIETHTPTANENFGALNTVVAYPPLSISPLPLQIRKRSKDLVLQVMVLDKGIKGHVTIHNNDTVSVILACSDQPINFDIGGLVRLTSSLARIEERLAFLIDAAVLQDSGSCTSTENSCGTVEDERQLSLSATANVLTTPATPQGVLDKNLVVAEYGSWIVTMWHVGFDSLECYSGERFEVAWEDFTGEWIRVYSKEITSMEVGAPRRGQGKKISKRKNIVKLRIENQEYPKSPLHMAVEQKLSSIRTAYASTTDAA